MKGVGVALLVVVGVFSMLFAIGAWIMYIMPIVEDVVIYMRPRAGDVMTIVVSGFLVISPVVIFAAVCAALETREGQE